MYLCLSTNTIFSSRLLFSSEQKLKSNTKANKPEQINRATLINLSDDPSFRACYLNSKKIQVYVSLEHLVPRLECSGYGRQGNHVLIAAWIYVSSCFSKYYSSRREKKCLLIQLRTKSLSVWISVLSDGLDLIIFITLLIKSISN